MTSSVTESYYEDSYSERGFGAQRRFPNEELCRFMGRNYFSLSKKERQRIRILETGCGSGANLWMLAKEGFEAVGIDLSRTAVELCQKMLNTYGATAELHVGNMTNLPFDSGTFDSVIDVFSSNCLTHDHGMDYLDQVANVLKQNGLFFSYFPSTKSDTWTQQHTSKGKLDAHTLDGLHRRTGPFYGNFYPFRFLSPEQYVGYVEKVGLSVRYCETVGRTYRKGEEYFEWVVIEAIKVD